MRRRGFGLLETHEVADQPGDRDVHVVCVEGDRATAWREAKPAQMGLWEVAQFVDRRTGDEQRHRAVQDQAHPSRAGRYETDVARGPRFGGGLAKAAAISASVGMMIRPGMVAVPHGEAVSKAQADDFDRSA